jgi:TolA protein
MTLREALVILDLSERTLEPSMLNISLKNRLEKTDLRNVTRVLEAYRKVNSFLNPTLDTQGDSKGTVIDEPVEDGPPIQTAKSSVAAVKSETGLRRDYVPVPAPNPTLLGASGHYEAGNTTVMIDPSDTPHQQHDPRQTSILIDDLNDAYPTPAPRAVSRQLAPLAVVGLGLLAFAGGLGGMAVVSKLLNPPPSINTSVTDPVDPNTVAIAKPSATDPSVVKLPNSSVNTNPENSNAANPSVNPTIPSPNQPLSTNNPTNQTTKPNVAVIKPPAVQKPIVAVATPEISAPVKPTKSQAQLEQEAKAKAAELEKARQTQLEKARLAQVEKARLETIKAAQEKARQAQLEQARLKANKLALEKAAQAKAAATQKARQAELEKARQIQLAKARNNTNAQALAKARANAKAKAAAQARLDARIKARQEARLKAAQEARANALAQARAKASADRRAKAAAQFKARAQAKARAQSQAVVVNSSARNLSNNRSQFYAWDRNGAVLRYGSWAQIPQSIKTARAGTFRASVFVAASPASMPDIKP